MGAGELRGQLLDPPMTPCWPSTWRAARSRSWTWRHGFHHRSRLDHGPMLLRSVPSARQIPVSVEWTARMGSRRSIWGAQLAQRPCRGVDGDAAEFTAHPSDERLTELLAALDAEPNCW